MAIPVSTKPSSESIRPSVNALCLAVNPEAEVIND
jgi:hypothetical protein